MRFQVVALTPLGRYTSAPADGTLEDFAKVQKTLEEMVMDYVSLELEGGTVVVLRGNVLANTAFLLEVLGE